ncbi:MAG: DUF4386 family protein [Thermoleophilia bacterium]
MRSTTPATRPAQRCAWARPCGWAALLLAGTFVFGIAMLATALGEYTTGEPTAAESVAFVADNQAVLHAWYVVTLIVFGLALVPLALGLHQRLRGDAPVLAQVAGALGLVWAGLVIAAGMIASIGVGTVADLAAADPAQARSVWSTLDSVQDGLGGGNEVVGGAWVLLVSLAAWRRASFPRPVGALGIAAGLAGLATVVPPLEALGLAFGVGLIPWFVAVGIVLLRARTRPAGPSTADPRIDLGRSLGAGTATGRRRAGAATG